METFSADEKSFCCFGCRAVYELLKENNLCAYYDFQKKPGIKQSVESDDQRYAILEDSAVSERLLEFKSSDVCRTTFDIPSIHCISCIWLLENLYRLNPGVIRSEINFSKKTVTIFFKSDQITFRQLAEILASIGYPPKITLESEVTTTKQSYNKLLLVKLAVAGFAFGNIMLLSFPEYLGLQQSEKEFTYLFSALNILLSIPVLVFSSSDYLLSAYYSLKAKKVNLDVPLSIGILALFFRSLYEVWFNLGPGYFDSFAGLLFFLLIGRWFQNLTFENLSFDRDYRSFFPLAVQRLSDKKNESVLVYQLNRGDIIFIRNQEIIPCDSELMAEDAIIDYSFVTGESRPVLIQKGERIYAGGKLLGKPAKMMVEKKIEQSHLIHLWNSEAFRKQDEGRFKRMVDTTATTFTWIILSISIIAGVFWYFIEPVKIWLVVSSILIVACPCALALSAPFTFGSMMRVFGRNGFYLKNSDVLEKMAQVDRIVFDKTGTITEGEGNIYFRGDLNNLELGLVKAVASSSTHLLSARISNYIKVENIPELQQLLEIPGKGLEAKSGVNLIRIGSGDWLGAGTESREPGSMVFVEINGSIKGYFTIHPSVRPGLRNLINRLGSRCLALISGDQSWDNCLITGIFPPHTKILFEQSPTDKLQFIQQNKHYNIMMVGDGLNDAGALKAAYIGVAVSDDTSVFTPSCDAIIQGSKLNLLDHFLDLSKSATKIVKWCFVISFLYNVIGLSFAVSGNLTPLVAAILMPLSSITVFAFTTIAVMAVTIRKQI